MNKSGNHKWFHTIAPLSRNQKVKGDFKLLLPYQETKSKRLMQVWLNWSILYSVFFMLSTQNSAVIFLVCDILLHTITGCPFLYATQSSWVKSINAASHLLGLLKAGTWEYCFEVFPIFVYQLQSTDTEMTVKTDSTFVLNSSSSANAFVFYFTNSIKTILEN